MKKYVKLTLCGLTAAVMIAGCSKKETETATEPAVESTSESPAQSEAADQGEVTKLGTYKGVEITKMSTEVTDEELESRIQSILDANPEYIEITDRPAQNGDVVNIDYVGMKDGEAFEGGTAQGYDLELGSGSFIDGFEAGLVGASTGQELSLNLTFPEAYQNAELAGQAVVFDVTVNKIEEKKDAVLDDNFVQRMSDFTTVDEFRADTLADLETERQTQAEQQLENDAFQAALDNSEFAVNETAVEEQYNSQLEYYTSMVQMYGMTLTDYVSMFGMTQEQFEEQIRTSADMAIRQQLLVKAIAEEEGMQVEDEDRQKIADEYGMDIATLQESYGEEAVEETALMYKVVSFIKENAVIK